MLGEEEVFGRVAGDGEFRKCDDIGTDAARFVDRGCDQLAVARNIADGGVYLCGGDSDGGHIRGSPILRAEPFAVSHVGLLEEAQAYTGIAGRAYPRTVGREDRPER